MKNRPAFAHILRKNFMLGLCLALCPALSACVPDIPFVSGDAAFSEGYRAGCRASASQSVQGGPSEAPEEERESYDAGYRRGYDSCAQGPDPQERIVLFKT